jgi:hypothetical protein
LISELSSETKKLLFDIEIEGVYSMNGKASERGERAKKYQKNP